MATRTGRPRRNARNGRLRLETQRPRQMSGVWTARGCPSITPSTDLIDAVDHAEGLQLVTCSDPGFGPEPGSRPSPPFLPPSPLSPYLRHYETARPPPSSPPHSAAQLPAVPLQPVPSSIKAPPLSPPEYSLMPPVPAPTAHPSPPPPPLPARRRPCRPPPLPRRSDPLSPPTPHPPTHLPGRPSATPNPASGS